MQHFSQKIPAKGRPETHSCRWNDIKTTLKGIGCKNAEFRIRLNGGPLWTQLCTFGFNKEPRWMS